MKWVALILLLLAVAPFASWMRSNPAYHPTIWKAFGFIALQHGPLKLYMGPISWGGWPGISHGAEVSLLDALALAIFMGLPRAKRPFPFRAVMVLYILAVVISSLQGHVMLQPAYFYVWQLLRVFFIAVVVGRAVALDERVARYILFGMGIGLILAVWSAGWDRVVRGDFQAGGSFGHQNTLGMMSHFVVFPFLSLLLSGAPGWLPLIIPVAGGLVAILTVSRATIGIIGFGYALLFGLSSVVRGWSRQKTKVILSGVVVIAVLSPFAIASFEKRFARDQARIESMAEGEEEERLVFQRVASMMLSDYPLGVGANQYVHVANTQGYADRAGVIPTYQSRRAMVHHVYWLVAAETGYLGIVTFLLFLAHPLLTALRSAWRYRGDPRADMLLGLAVGLLAVYVHSMFEWLLLSFQPQYMLAVSFGLIAGLSQPLSEGRRNGDAPESAGEPKRLFLTAEVPAPKETEVLRKPLRPGL